MAFFWGADVAKKARSLARPAPTSRSTSRQSKRRSSLSTAGSILSSIDGSSGLHHDNQGLHGSMDDKVTLRKVLKILTGILHRELERPQAYSKVFLPPKRVDKKYYPDTVYDETRDFFLESSHKKLRREDKRAEELVARQIHYASADKQRYAFDRTSGNYIANAANDAELQVRRKKNELARGQTKEVADTLKMEGLWVKQQTKSSEQEIDRFEHLLHVLETEQKAEIDREIRIIGEQQDRGNARVRRHKISKVLEERADAADRIMRILQDYELVSGGQMAAYLQRTLHQISQAPGDASALFQASISGRTLNGAEDEVLSDGDDTLESIRRGSTRGSRGTSTVGRSRGKGGMAQTVPLDQAPRARNIRRSASTAGLGTHRPIGSQGVTSGVKRPLTSNDLVPATAPTTLAGPLSATPGGLPGKSRGSTRGGLGPRAGTPAVIKTPRGRYAPIVMDNAGEITNIGFEDMTKNRSASTAETMSSSSAMRVDSPLSFPATQSTQSKLPDGPLSQRGRALLYKNYRALLCEAQQDEFDSMVSKQNDMGGMSHVSFLGGIGGSSIGSGSRGLASSGMASNLRTPLGGRRATPWTATGKERISDAQGRPMEAGWYPHMGTMPAPVSVAERAMEDEEHKIQRDGRGLPPEEIMKDDVDPFIGKLRWAPKEGDFNFYPELERPAYSKSYAADKILRNMQLKKKIPSDAASMPTYRMSMAQHGARTYGESANSFSFLVGRPIHEHQ